jgi:hypothetical protein
LEGDRESREKAAECIIVLLGFVIGIVEVINKGMTNN